MSSSIPHYKRLVLFLTSTIPRTSQLPTLHFHPNFVTFFPQSPASTFSFVLPSYFFLSCPTSNFPPHLTLPYFSSSDLDLAYAPASSPAYHEPHHSSPESSHFNLGGRSHVSFSVNHPSIYFPLFLLPATKSRKRSPACFARFLWLLSSRPSCRPTRLESNSYRQTGSLLNI